MTLERLEFRDGHIYSFIRSGRTVRRRTSIIEFSRDVPRFAEGFLVVVILSNLILESELRFVAAAESKLTAANDRRPCEKAPL